MPILKRGCIYQNIDPKKNGYVNSIIPVNDIKVDDKLFNCFKVKEKENEPNEYSVRKKD